MISEWKTEAQSGFFSSSDIILGKRNPVGTYTGGWCSIRMALLQARDPLSCSLWWFLSARLLHAWQGSTLTVTVPQHPQKHLIFIKTSWIFIAQHTIKFQQTKEWENCILLHLSYHHVSFSNGKATKQDFEQSLCCYSLPHKTQLAFFIP